MQLTQPERRLRATEVLCARGRRPRRAAVRGDEELLASALAGLVMATVGLVGEKGGPTTLSASVKDGRVTFAVVQESLSVPESWVDRTFDAVWPVATTAAGTLALMQSARRIGELHGGTVTATSTRVGHQLQPHAAARRTRDVNRYDPEIRACDLRSQDLSWAMFVRITLPVALFTPPVM